MKQKIFIFKHLSVVLVLLGIIACTGKSQAEIKKNEPVDILEQVTLGGVKQWISVKSDNADNPILLWLHGGPGYAAIPWMHLFPRLKENFTYVAWDQRNAGLSYDPENIPEDSMNVEQFLDDAHELIQLLCKRYNQQKVYIFGHSWGSMMGIYLSQRYPELIHAYIGGGQVVNMEALEIHSYNFVMDRARDTGNQAALEQLTAIGKPPYDSEEEMLTQRYWLWQLGGLYYDPSYNEAEVAMKSGVYSREHVANIDTSLAYSVNLMWDEILALPPIEESVPALKVPVYFIYGIQDYNTPGILIENYAKKLKAKKGKSVIVIQQASHMFPWTRPDKFQDILINTVLEETYKS